MATKQTTKRAPKLDADTKAMMKTNGGIAPARAAELQSRSTKARQKVDAAKAEKTTVVPTGAANGAETQPHTKQALKQARAAERKVFDETKDAQVAAGNVYLLDPARNVTKWYAAKGKHPVGAVQLYPVPGAKKTAQATARAASKARQSTGPKAAATPRTTANRAYTSGPKTNDAKAGTWRHYMLTTIQAHKGTDAAKAAHAKSGQFSGNALDFNWSAKQGYITFA